MRPGHKDGRRYRYSQGERAAYHLLTLDTEGVRVLA